MTLTIQQWHNRFQQQAQWTKSIRNYLFDKVDIDRAHRILDIGCGTGVLLEEVHQITSIPAYGVDINYTSIKFAHRIACDSFLSVGDAIALPFADNSFEVAMCHYLLLWIKDPLEVIKEMVRVVHPGRYVLAIAEPDYGGRIDFPMEFTQIGEWQIDALKEQGANPYFGRQLAALFSNAGLKDIEVGILGGQWRGDQITENSALEWEMLESDLSQNKEFIKVSEILKQLDKNTRISNHRILYVPTFYAIGVV